MFELDYPTLALVRDTYGQKTAISWLSIEIDNLSEYAGCKGKLEVAMIFELATEMLLMAQWMNVVQIMYFFRRMKRGDFGSFYGTVDAMLISRYFREHIEDIASEINLRRKEAERANANSAAAMAKREQERYRTLIPGAYTDDQVISKGAYDALGCISRSDQEILNAVDYLQRTGRRIVSGLTVARMSAEERSSFASTEKC